MESAFDMTRLKTTLLLIAMQAMLSLLATSAGGQDTRQAFPSLKGLDGGLAGLGDLLGDTTTGAPIGVSGRIVQATDQKFGWLQVAVKLGEDWHISSVTQPDGGPTRTSIELQPSSDFRVVGSFQPDVKPTVVPPDLFPVPEEYHLGRVVWTARIEFLDGVNPASVTASGYIKGQICQDNGGCMPIGQRQTSFTAAYAGKSPAAAEVSAQAGVASELDGLVSDSNSRELSRPVQQEASLDSQAGTQPGGDLTASRTSADQGYLTDTGSPMSAQETSTDSESSEAEQEPLGRQLPKYLALALAAGFILNFMPCVLPVIGLKIMSFVNQAGEDRRRILYLNLAFCAGLMVVFLIFATLSAFFGMSWGAWLTRSMAGPIVIAGVVFAFGLSMLGVWEIPVPGFSGSSKAGQLAEQEGLSGAFFLGIFTTILATPCTGPLLLPATTITAGQPAWVAYLIFSFLGLGMAIPYLVIGLVPSLIRLLPKPGAWMDTFKQLMGFVLMATVVFLIRSFGQEPRSDYFLPVLSMLLVIAVGCWWVGRIPFSAGTRQKLTGWMTALVIIGLGTAGAFVFFAPPKYELNYQQFSATRLGELRDDNRIVFVDFTGPG